MSAGNSSDWRPHESSADLWGERSYLDGIFIGAVAYGVHATLFFITLNLLWSRPRSTWKDYSWIAYIVVLFILSSIGNGSQLKFTQMIFIDYRNYPGGPAAYYIEGSTNFMAAFCNSVYTVNTWFQDGLLLYRFWIIFGSSYLVLALPALIYTASIALGIMMIVMLSRPGMTIWTRISFQTFTAYFSVSIAFNIVLTLAIVSRLLLTRRRVGKALTAAGPYISVSAMLVESAFLYSAWGIAFLVAYGLDSPVQNLLLPTLAQVQSIAPLLIIMRVAQGQAWSPTTKTTVTNATFAFRKNGRSGEMAGADSAPSSGEANSTDIGTFALSGGSGSGLLNEKVHEV